MKEVKRLRRNDISPNSASGRRRRHRFQIGATESEQNDNEFQSDFGARSPAPFPQSFAGRGSRLLVFVSKEERKQCGFGSRSSSKGGSWLNRVPAKIQNSTSVSRGSSDVSQSVDPCVSSSSFLPSLVTQHVRTASCLPGWLAGCCH